MKVSNKVQRTESINKLITSGLDRRSWLKGIAKLSPTSVIAFIGSTGLK